jgi:hypothetical protein
MFVDASALVRGVGVLFVFVWGGFKFLRLFLFWWGGLTSPRRRINFSSPIFFCGLYSGLCFYGGGRMFFFIRGHTGLMWVCICMSSLAHKSEITHPRGGSSSRSPPRKGKEGNKQSARIIVRSTARENLYAPARATRVGEIFGQGLAPEGKTRSRYRLCASRVARKVFAEESVKIIT